MRDHSLNQLFLRYREQGDVKALGKLFDQLSQELSKVARHVARDVAEAEDLVQATFLTAMEHPERFDENRPITAWLVGVLTKEALAWRRQSARRPDAERLAGARGAREQEGQPDLVATNEESEGLITAAIARLPQRYRTVLHRHLQLGLSPSEIASESDTSPATIRVRLHRGMAHLRQLLPASMAGGLVLTLAPRGLAAIKDELVAHAAKNASTTATTAGSSLATAKIGSLLMLQRIGLGTLAILTLVFLTKLGLDSTTVNHASPEANEIVRVLSTANNSSTSSEDERKTNREDAVAATPESGVRAVEISTPLHIKTIWADGTPAPNIGFQYLCFEPNSKVSRARTDDQGLITLMGLVPGQYALYGDRGGHATAQVLQLSVSTEKARELELNPDQLLTMETTLQLEPGTDVRGRVLDTAGRGVANAAVWISTGTTRASGFEVARSSSDGSFEVKQLTAECFLGARADGHAPSKPEHVQYWKERLAQGATAIERDLHLNGPDARISGLVLDPYGQPAQDARVRIGAQDLYDTFGPTGVAGPPPPIEVRTDEQGQFATRGITPGAVHIACLATGYPVAIETIQVEASARGRVALRLEEGAWVRGQVTAEDGTPLERISISAWRERLDGQIGSAGSSFDKPETQTDNEGRFAIGPFGAGKIRLSAQTPDKQSSATSSIVVVSGEEYRWEATLTSLPKIEGHAVDESGQPLSGWTVSAEPMSPFGPPPVAVFTQQDGSFAMTLASSGPCRLMLYEPNDEGHPDRMFFTAKAPNAWIDDVETGTKDVRIRLDPAREPTGVLIGDLISESGVSPPKLLATVFHDEFHEVGNIEFPSGTTHFEFRDLPAGTLSLRIEPIGFAPIWRRDIEMAQGGLRDLGQLSLASGGDLRVALRCSSGATPERLDVKLTDARGTNWYVEIEGAVITRDSLPPGSYTLQIQAQDCGPYEGRLEIRSEQRCELDIELTSGGGIGFVLLTADGNPLGMEATLTVTAQDDQLLFAETLQPSSNGHVAAWLFAPYGRLRVTAETANGHRVTQHIPFAATDSSDTPHRLLLQ